MKPLLSLISEYTGDDAISLISAKYDPLIKNYHCSIVNHGVIKSSQSVDKEFSDWDIPGFRKNFCGQFTKFAREVHSEY